MSAQDTHKPMAIVIGAGPGLGAASAKAFGRAGYDIALIARSAKTLSDLGSDLHADGITTGWAPADVADPLELAAAIDRFGQHTGRIDVLHFNPSKYRAAAAADLTAEMLLDDLAVGAASLLTAFAAARPFMQRQGSGTVLVTGSQVADRPMRSAGSLGVQKAAVRTLVQSLANDVRDEGIHVATVTVRGTIKEGTAYSPEKIAREFVSLAVETSAPREQWRTVVDFEG